MTMSEVTPERPADILRATGWSGDPEYFTFREYDTFRPEAVVDILRGRSVGVVFRGMVGRETCDELSARFWNSLGRRRRVGVAPSYYLGAYHYGRTTAQYLDESGESAGPLARVLDVPDEPLAVFYGGLAETLAPEGVTVRRARHEGREACAGLLRSWHGDGEYALDPHEDSSQCTTPEQRDFEIQRVVDHHVTALNICLENTDGGKLMIWNIRPDEATRRRLGLEHTGVPYPTGELEGVECREVEIRTGDVYVFCGAHVHAVEPNTDRRKRRTTLAGILGFIDEETVVSWT